MLYIQQSVFGELVLCIYQLEKRFIHGRKSKASSIQMRLIIIQAEN